MSSVRRAGPSARIIRLALGETPFTYRAGQWARIGPGGQPQQSPYSIASAPEDSLEYRRLEFLIRVDAHGRWGESFQPLSRGDRLVVKGPFGRFTFPDSPIERDFLFVAGGTGIAPVRSMIRHARAARVDGSLRLLYSARTPDDLAYLAEFRGMARRRELRLALTTTRAGHDRWRGGRGRISASELAGLIDTPQTLCFVCGPAGMVAEVRSLLSDLGIDRRRILVEEL